MLKGPIGMSHYCTAVVDGSFGKKENLVMTDPWTTGSTLNEATTIRIFQQQWERENGEKGGRGGEDTATLVTAATMFRRFRVIVCLIFGGGLASCSILIE